MSSGIHEPIPFIQSILGQIDNMTSRDRYAVYILNSVPCPAPLSGGAHGQLTKYRED